MANERAWAARAKREARFITAAAAAAQMYKDSELDVLAEFDETFAALQPLYAHGQGVLALDLVECGLVHVAYRIEGGRIRFDFPRRAGLAVETFIRDEPTEERASAVSRDEPKPDTVHTGLKTSAKKPLRLPPDFDPYSVTLHPPAPRAPTSGTIFDVGDPADGAEGEKQR